jgi:hypothetical protein
VKLEGPKHKKFLTGIFTQTNPIWMGDLGARPKI